MDFRPLNLRIRSIDGPFVTQKTIIVKAVAQTVDDVTIVIKAFGIPAKHLSKVRSMIMREPKIECGTFNKLRAVPVHNKSYHNSPIDMEFVYNGFSSFTPL